MPLLVLDLRKLDERQVSIVEFIKALYMDSTFLLDESIPIAEFPKSVILLPQGS